MNEPVRRNGMVYMSESVPLLRQISLFFSFKNLFLMRVETDGLIRVLDSISYCPLH